MLASTTAEVQHPPSHRGCLQLWPGRWTHVVALPSGGRAQLTTSTCSPRSALRGAEQSSLPLGIWHTTRASPLPIRPPTHLHPSPIQTLSAINKQCKCQPVPRKSPRQLCPIQWPQEQLSCTVPEQKETKQGSEHGLCIPPGTLHSSCQQLTSRSER